MANDPICLQPVLRSYAITRFLVLLSVLLRVIHLLHGRGKENGSVSKNNDVAEKSCDAHHSLDLFLRQTTLVVGDGDPLGLSGRLVGGGDILTKGRRVSGELVKRGDDWKLTKIPLASTSNDTSI